MPIINTRETLTKVSQSGASVVAVAGYFTRQAVSPKTIKGMFVDLTSRRDLKAYFQPTAALDNAYDSLAYLIDKGSIVRVLIKRDAEGDEEEATNFVDYKDALKEAVMDGRVSVLATCGWNLEGAHVSDPAINTIPADTVLMDICTDLGIQYLPDISSKDLLPTPALTSHGLAKIKEISPVWPALGITGIKDDVISIIPGSIIGASVIAYCDRLGGPWLVPAGVKRATVYNVVGFYSGKNLLELKSEDYTKIKALGVNTFKTVGNNVVLLGNFTAVYDKDNPSLFDQVNVTRMVGKIKKEVRTISSGLFYEFNNETTWDTWQIQVNDYLSIVQAGGGIVRFLAVMDETTISPEDIVNRIARGRIVLEATGVIQDIIIDIEITDSEVTFMEVAN